MQALILAAGMGKRLQALTQNNTKCMIKVNGVRLIERMLRILDKKNLSQIIMVVGYQSGKLISFIETLQIKTPIIFIENPVYDKTNNIYSLALAKEYLEKEDTLLLESDLIFEEKIIDILVEDERESLALVDKFESWMDGTCLVLDDKDNITDFIPGKYLRFEEKGHYYKTVNIYKFGKKFSSEIYVPFLDAYVTAMGENEYYESVIKLILMLEKNTLKAKRIEDELWYEIDDIQDLDIASTLFIEDNKEKYKHLMSRYGGYWRYPHLKDFCYLVNPYFPPNKMIEEIKSNFETLLVQYPSGIRINSLLVAKNFNVKEKHIVVGNGAAELIRELLDEMKGKVGIIRPTFEEYPNRCTDRYVIYDCVEDDFSYSVEQIQTYFEKNKIEILICINPDNPTGHYWNQEECGKLLDWCAKKNIKLVLDESFADFADGEETFVDEEMLQKYRNLYVIKSISKSHGVPGLRLGILASGDEKTIAFLKRKVSIWNINSFAEFYNQIYGKYKADFEEAINLIKSDRCEMQKQLQDIQNLKVYPSQANYIMCEILGGMTSEELAAKLLETNILIKDLTEKIKNGKQYIRVAVRTKKENNILIEKLKKLLQ